MTTTAMQLSLVESQTLEHLERAIADGMKTFVRVGRALVDIRDQRLYREQFATFDDYCRDRWSMERTYAHRLIEAAETVNNLLPIGNTLPVNEAQVRPLTHLEPAQQREVWQEVIATAPATGITGRHVQNVVNEVRERIAAGTPANEAIADVSLSIRIPTPTEAKTLARETGLLVIASNNRMYDDRSEEQIAAEHKVTTLLYRVFEAINVLAGVTVPPSEYVALMRPDQSYHLADHLESAAVWLNELTEEWRCHSTHP